eukprot:5311647-Amphidinium_carterae.1
MHVDSRRLHMWSFFGQTQWLCCLCVLQRRIRQHRSFLGSVVGYTARQRQLSPAEDVAQPPGDHAVVGMWYDLY